MGKNSLIKYFQSSVFSVIGLKISLSFYCFTISPNKFILINQAYSISKPIEMISQYAEVCHHSRHPGIVLLLSLSVPLPPSAAPMNLAEWRSL